jgi:kynurenine formamidase
MRRCLPVLFCLLAVACGSSATVSQPSTAFDLTKFKVVDLTHPLGTSTVFWPTSTERFTLKVIAHGQTPGGYFYAANNFCTPEHGGTHLDAPMHFGEGKWSSDQIPVEKLVAPAVVIDTTQKTSNAPDYRLTRQDVLDFESAHGRIAAGTIVLMRTGWSRRWPDVKAYLGDDTPGDASKLSFPSYGEEAAKLLIEERQVGVLGIDTASTDYGRSTDFVVHRLAAAHNVPGLENLRNLDQLPATGAVVVALPTPIEGGSGGPLRAIALVPR